MPFDGTENPKVVLLEEARRILHKRGWGQGKTYNMFGNVCLYGAIREAADTVPHSYLIMRDLAFHSVVNFNDAPGRTLAEIDSWLDERIAEAFHA